MGWLRLRVAAKLYPQYRFVLVQWVDRAWRLTPITPNQGETK